VQQQLPEVQQLPLMEVEQLQAVEHESWDRRYKTFFQL
jgi:hypothetical protein